MNSLKFISCLLVVFGFTSMAIAQTDDDINITAAFSSSIDCTVTAGANISFTVATLDDYNNGLADPTAYSSTFEVNSSVNFKVDLTSTNFTDGSNTLDAQNFGYTISDNGNNAAGTNHKLLGESNTTSGYALLGTNEEIVTSYGDGNAGNAADNSFILKFELGTAAVRTESGLGTLLSQNIAPGSYTSTVTITASAMP